MTKTNFMVPESAALYSRKFESLVQLSQGAKISGDLLLQFG
ncbi:hypothetical protein [Bartonella vinsonii]|nr:hypothetical protein [Bartonella vinsonii]